LHLFFGLTLIYHKIIVGQLSILHSWQWHVTQKRHTHKMHCCLHCKMVARTCNKITFCTPCLSCWNVTLFGISEINYFLVQYAVHNCSVKRVAYCYSLKMEQHFLPERRKYLPDHKIHTAEQSKLQGHSHESLKSNTKQMTTKILILIIKGLVTGQCNY